MTLFIVLVRIALDMNIKKLVIVLVGCFALASCATFDPKIGPTGYNSVKNISIKDKNSSKIFIIHQPYEWPTLAIKSHVYVDGKLFARTLPYLVTLYETKQPKVQIDVYGEYCSTGEKVKDYGSSKILLDLKPGEDTYLVIREKRTVFEVPTALVFGLIFCNGVESDKSAYHDIRRVSKAAWDELSNIKNPKSFNTSYITFDDKDLEAARELLLKEQK
jgi:hypothetical protein